MKLHAPAVPLITVDPYFSIWSMSNQLNADVTRHWSNKPHRITGILDFDGSSYCFMGISEFTSMKQEKLTIDSLTTQYVFSTDDVELKVEFMTPLLLEDPELCSRPITYVSVYVNAKDGKKHSYSLRFIADDEICLNHKGQWDTQFSYGETDCYTWGKVGSVPQQLLNKSGDDIRIDWGYLYLAVKKQKEINIQATALPSQDETETKSGRLQMSIDFPHSSSNEALLAFAYDDIKSIEYFEEHLDAYWKNDDTPDIMAALHKAFLDYPGIKQRCDKFSDEMNQKAKAFGGDEYAELLSLAYRQTVAAHKICREPEGELLFISKECFSNGCAATVDVSYPSSPLYLLYNPELVKGMLRPIFKYAATPDWPYEFAPHDAGEYPKVNGQVYGYKELKWQMPVEECGNVLIMTAAICIAQKNISFAKDNWALLEKWVDYLLRTGMDPENQLCTDDFAGHLAHNCNLSIKAIMGITAFSILCRMRGYTDRADELLREARSMAGKWTQSARNADGSFRLAFDMENSFSMKYNLIWDKLWETKIFDFEDFKDEFASYLKKSNQFGMPLDNRADYTKSDWLVWTATLLDSNEKFKQFISPLYAAYNNSPTRVPLTDWYDTKTSKMIAFQNRTVQGGLFIGLLLQDGICSVLKNKVY